MARPRRYITARQVQASLETQLAAQGEELDELRHELRRIHHDVAAIGLIVAQHNPLLRDILVELRQSPALTANAVIAVLPTSCDQAA